MFSNRLVIRRRPLFVYVDLTFVEKVSHLHLDWNTHGTRVMRAGPDEPLLIPPPTGSPRSSNVEGSPPPGLDNRTTTTSPAAAATTATSRRIFPPSFLVQIPSFFLYSGSDAPSPVRPSVPPSVSSVPTRRTRISASSSHPPRRTIYSRTLEGATPAETAKRRGN